MSPLIEAVLWKLGATSVQTAVLVLVVWALCRGVRRLPAATQTWLWWLVGVQAVVGLVWSNPVQLPVLPAHNVTSALGSADSLAPLANATAAASTAAHAGATAQAMQAGAWSIWPVALLALWAAGVLVLAAGTARAYLRSRALVRAAQPCNDQALVQALQMAAEAHGLSRPPALRLSSQIDSPQLIGPWQPVLLLPAARLPHMADDDLDMALTHELIHLRRGDLWWGLLPALAQHLFFFHPLVHLAAREYAIAREAACDAAVVAGHRHCRHDYGRLLLQLGVAPRPRGGVASASPSFISLKRRLSMLQDTHAFPRLAAAMILAAVAVCGVLPLRLVAMPVPAPVTSAGMQPVVVTAPPAPRVQGSSTAEAADAAAPMRALPAPALPAAPAEAAAPATHGVIADVLGAEPLHDEDADPTDSGWNLDLDRIRRDATHDAQAAVRDAFAADNHDLELQQDRMQAAQDALQEAREQLASLGPELAQAKQEAQQQARQAQQQIRDVAQQHRQAQYAYAAAVRQADALSRHQVEMAKQAALQGRAEARRGQREAAQAQREAAQAQVEAEKAQAEADQAQAEAERANN
ncbi:M56 family metallopeptidase [Xanthomonas citri pv. anacardii]|uniref:M56 family metallopeptidase n=1 Tax=Xanthomonas citri TaxID=346 RepID=UPI000CCC6585|nr:M56 family metallopeptidase [Xanthomonas citri]MCT8358113.1 M56 family metallopeptidase [Xanthomonas citri pv. anacardii]MCT8362171.1 M56 family metallopeptidase [Xanthomonas citri pv. anacardii]MCT8366222.1 M56 family metallopeptidase [Xanthomonas citri pv. anacardii]MCT8370246.1 M56 family metallopeptidase [Xanthomonas citri pv. anacardii]MCT8374210.1 M56 family metallopeptidase [Xanthomonas citri pv. anacardii]